MYIRPKFLMDFSLRNSISFQVVLFSLFQYKKKILRKKCKIADI